MLWMSWSLPFLISYSSLASLAADSSEPIYLAIDRDGPSQPAVLRYAAERIFMRLHDMLGSALGLGAGLSGVFGSVDRGPCTILQTESAE